MRTAILLVCLVLWSVNEASATPVSYRESISGDFGNFLPASSILPFDFGVNPVSGSQLYFVAARLDLDSFAFSIPSGGRLTQIGYAFTESHVAGTSLAQTIYRLGIGNAEFPFIGTVSIDILGASPLALFAPNLPIGPGIYGMANLAAQTSVDSGWSSDYTWTFTVEPATVPEPATLLLCTSSLVGLTAIRRRRRSAGVTSTSTVSRSKPIVGN